MDNYDVAVIGGGVLGCFVARNLARYRLRIILIEKNAELCAGITSANTGIVYSGYDTKPGSLKSRLCTRANRDFPRLCRELALPFRACGSLMTAAGPRAEAVLRRKYEQGLANGLTDLSLLQPPAIHEMEPHLAPDVTLALFSPSVGTVNPWELGLAAADNASQNGVSIRRNLAVNAIARTAAGYALTLTNGLTLRVQAVVNAAGLGADAVSELLIPPYFRILPTRGDYFILDSHLDGFIRHVIQQEPEEKGKAATLVPTVDGNLLVGPSSEAALDKADRGTTASGLAFLRQTALSICPELPLSQVIRSFAALRPNPYWAERKGETVIISDRSIQDFLIDEPENYPGFINLAGIKTPGLTAANEIGAHVAGLVAERLNACENSAFEPSRYAESRFARLSPAEQAEVPGSLKIVCRCMQVTEPEIRAAVRGELAATTLDGVKRRTGAGMGRCQGGFCTEQILRLLAAEQGRNIGALTKNSSDSWIARAQEEHQRRDEG